jgi:hypothetical protein
MGSGAAGADDCAGIARLMGSRKADYRRTTRSWSAVAAGELASPGVPRGVAFQQIDAATDQPLGQRHAEMTSAAVGPSLVDFEDDRTVGHESHMPNRPIVESGDFHRGTFREKRRQGRRPCLDEARYNRRLKCPAALAADWRNEDDVDGRVEPAFDLVKLCRLFTWKRQSSATFVGDQVVRSLLRRGNC